MKRILTNNIVENTRRQPFTKASIDHIQQAFQEVFTSVFKMLNANTSSYFKLHGLVNSGAGSDYDISAGAVYFNGEVFQVDAFVGTAGVGEVPVLTLQTTFHADDPVRFTDNNEFNVHEIKKMVITLAASGSGDVNFSALAPFFNNFVSTDKIEDGSITAEKLSQSYVRQNVVAFGSGDLNSINPGLSATELFSMQVASGANANAPTANAADIFFVISNYIEIAGIGNRIQIAIQVDGAAVGTIHKRTKVGAAAWGAWSSINT